ncbi:hypothetical protein DSM03_10783 [Leeuwenhoekiella aestuarii]|uniref:Transporter n=1 Tax=Leeuwenhoekiella aestuarii TaxID=2249426 RepID=A0A4Q0NRR4_9FLAO|nr:transporter [Leeuwenhoekiella aestuarii]RXG11986.1 hypothetical protein DSM04_10883 [Leeuwenhoekiella aestuarii]RXG13544.1 hypothetical protein DSM03_10783 [Leeuwenhoekiella aestuarii]
MEKTIFLFAFLLIGILCKKYSVTPKGLGGKLNKLLIHFFIPILTLRYLPEIEFSKKHIWLIISPWIIYGFSFLFFELINLFKPIERKTRAVLIMTSGIGSISFAGFPIFEMFLGSKGLAMGIILSLAGTFVVCNTIGVFTGFWYAQKQTSPAKLIKDIVVFPPFLAMVLAFILLFTNTKFADFINETLTILAKPFSFLALFTIGLNVSMKSVKRNKNFFLLGQSYKLIIAPLLVFLLFLFLGEHNTLVAKVCVLGAGLGSMNTIAIVAAELGLKPDLSFLMPGLGIPISILTVILIYFLIY